jgi:hypothetical protein
VPASFMQQGQVQVPASFLPPMSIAELEAQGASLLAAAGGQQRLTARHPFAFASMQTLTVRAPHVPGHTEGAYVRTGGGGCGGCKQAHTAATPPCAPSPRAHAPAGG